MYCFALRLERPSRLHNKLILQDLGLALAHFPPRFASAVVLETRAASSAPCGTREAIEINR